MGDERREFKRPSWVEFWMAHAKVISSRATCIRRGFGAIIVADKTSIAEGYKGSPKRWENCHNIGKCYRQEKGVPRGERYELCRGVHAELNAIINASRNGVKIPEGSEIYIYGFNVEDGSLAVGKPCGPCMRAIANTGIEKVFYNAAIIKDGRVVGHEVVSELVSDWAWEHGRYATEGGIDISAEHVER